MAATYAVGYSLGFIFGGCLIGLFPLIVAIVKKRVGLGIVLMLVCGVSSYISMIVPIIISVVSGLILCFALKKKEQ